MAMDNDKNNDVVLRLMQRKLIDASHILHYHGVLDAFGHVSFRHPIHKDIFVMSRAMAPGIIASPHDLIAYNIGDASPIEPTGSPGFVERMIHSETYKRHLHVQAIVHSHAEEVLPYTISSVPLRACYHMAGFLGANGTPIFDIADHIGREDIPDMLIRDARRGTALAKCFDDGSVVALMRGHGFTTVASSIEIAVLQAVYTKKNATISTAAISIQASWNLGNGEPAGLRYLDGGEATAAAEANARAAQRPWDLWVKEIESCSLYVNFA